MRIPSRISIWLLGFSFLALGQGSPANEASLENFETGIQPVLKEYCLNCHSTEKQKGEIDLEVFSSIDAVKRHPKVWQGVAEQLANGEMPPKDKPQLPPVEKERFTKWVAAMLDSLARERAGDPGPVVLRRLSNAEYTYTVRDLTGVESLEPAREFPVDGAAGEGFMNTGQALVMSPSLVSKYLDAAKEIASHAVLLPDGIRFSPKTTRRDWTEEVVGKIREFYRKYTDSRGGEKVNLQGVVFETNEGGRLPLEKYLTATLAEREVLKTGARDVDQVAHEYGLNVQYLHLLYTMLSSSEGSFLLANLRTRWRSAKPTEAPDLAAEIGKWQKALWKFNSVGHIGKKDGPKAWMESVTPLTSKQEIRFKIPAAPEGKDVTLYLVASDAGDGNEHDFVVWERPRLVAPGRPDILIRDVREITRQLEQLRERVATSVAKCLAAATEASKVQGAVDLAELARRHGVEAEILGAWFDYLGIGSREPLKIDSYLTDTISSASDHDFIKGWGKKETPQLLANSSDQHVRIPGNMKPHSVAVHPSPTLQTAVGWRSPVAGNIRIAASITHAHPECGNGVVWSLELRRGKTRQRLGSGVSQGGGEVKPAPIENISVQPGDFVSLLIGPRDGNHSCDLTTVDLIVTSNGDDAKTWSLAAEVSPDVLAGNPHADQYGNREVWHFYTEPVASSKEVTLAIPDGSLLSKWQMVSSAEEKQRLADEVQKLLVSGLPSEKESADAKLSQQLMSLSGPLINIARTKKMEAAASAALSNPEWGVDPVIFGRHPQLIDPASLCVRAPSVIEIRLPSELAAGCELVTSGSLDKTTGGEGSVQLQVLATKPEHMSGLFPSANSVTSGKSTWTDNNQRISHSAPIVVNDGSAARKRIEEAFGEFRQLFPAALCYTKIVPVDEVVTLTLFHREDDHLSRLMLNDEQKAKLDRLWNELHFVSQDALTLVDAFAQLMEYASQDGDPKVFEPLRKPITDRAVAFQRSLVDTEPKHLDALIELQRVLIGAH